MGPFLLVQLSIRLHRVDTIFNKLFFISTEMNTQ